MLLFQEQHEGVNVIHLVMGEETDFQLNMSGNIVIDLSENIDPNKKNILYINKCGSEEELQSQIAYFSDKQGNPKETKTTKKETNQVSSSDEAIVLLRSGKHVFQLFWYLPWYKL